MGKIILLRSNRAHATRLVGALQARVPGLMDIHDLGHVRVRFVSPDDSGLEFRGVSLRKTDRILCLGLPHFGMGGTFADGEQGSAVVAALKVMQPALINPHAILSGSHLARTNDFWLFFLRSLGWAVAARSTLAEASTGSTWTEWADPASSVGAFLCCLMPYDAFWIPGLPYLPAVTEALVRKTQRALGRLGAQWLFLVIAFRDDGALVLDCGQTSYGMVDDPTMELLADHILA